MEFFAVALIAGLVISLLPKTASQVVLLPDANGKTGSVVITPETGSPLTLDKAYSVATIRSRGASNNAVGDSAQLSQQFASTLAARPAPPVSFTLYFEFGSAVDILPSFQPVWQQISAALPVYPAVEVTVIGHTDRVGTQESNDILSLQRATTVRGLLVQVGIPATNIEVAGRGEREPIVPTDDEVAEPRNRRVEINLR